LIKGSSNQALIEPAGIFHVGQPEWPEGNCYQHHLKMNETPCTPPEEVERNEEMRKEKWKEICKQRKLTKKEQEHKDRWDREREQFEKWQLKCGF
jgi:hypothetical protein